MIGTGWLMLRRGQRLTMAGRNREALMRLRATVATAPDSAPAHMYLGLALAELGDYGIAARAMDRALELAPRNHAYISFRGILEYDRGCLEDALGYFTRALDACPGYTQALLYSSLSEIGMGRNTAGNMQEILRLEPHYTTELEARLLAYAERYLARHPGIARPLECLVQEPHPSGAPEIEDPGGLLEILGSELGGLDHAPAGVIHAHDTRAAELVDHHIAHKDFGAALEALGTYSGAAAREQYSGFIRGYLLYKLGRYEEGAGELREALASGPPVVDYEPYYYLGLCLLEAGTGREALRCFEHALQRINPAIARLRLTEALRIERSRQAAA